MTLHNEPAFANRMSPSVRQEKVFMQYIWMTCQKVSQVILPHNPCCARKMDHVHSCNIFFGRRQAGRGGTRKKWRCWKIKVASML